jgi:uncharacterized protein (TIGR02391 family)
MPQYARPLDLSDDDILSLPIDRLGFEILRQFDQGTQVHIYNYLNSWRNAGVDSNGQVMRALAEACEWLHHSGLVAEPSGIGDGFITRLGRQVLDRGLPHLGAVERLGRVGLHPRIETVRTQFLLGEYELAAFAAMKQVEVRVRELGGYDVAAIGRQMMRDAFKPGEGPLHDPAAERGEQQGLSDLFAGAIGVFKNPTSHRVVTFSDPMEAAEVVGLASLLLRILDRRETG